MFQRIRELAPIALFLLSAAAAGCSSPCETLASHICGCSLNKTEEAQCLEAVASSPREPTAADNETCDRLLETCTCKALEENNLAACGLAKE